jgi:tetratricopeptide (TPR) repeat protein
MSPTELPSGVFSDSEFRRLQMEVGELLKAQRFTEAIPPLVDASEKQPNDPRVHFALGGLYFETGQYSQAVAPLRRALAINPNIAIAHWHLGAALQMLGDLEGATEALETAVQIRPDLTDAHVRLALLYKQQGRRLEAREHYRLAAEHLADPAQKQLLEAQALLDERREGEAEALLRSALALDPELPMAHGLLGQLLVASGRFDEAARHFEAQIAQSPSTVMAYYDLVRSRRMTEADTGVLQRIDAALELPDFADVHRAVLLLARGKMLDDLGRYEEAMSAMDEASVLRSRTFAIDVGAFEKKVDRIIALFSSETIASRATPNPDRTPVFILGMPRSGTTLVEQIVSSHSDAAGADELTFWTERLEVLLELGNSLLAGDFLKTSAAEYLDVLRAISNTAARVTDKNPFNFLAAGLIHLAFPQAAIIHCRRNAADTALSIHQTHFARSTAMPTGGEELVRYFRAHQRLMAHWRQVLPEGRLFEVSYERLTSSPQPEIRRLLEHIGLPWNPACLNPHANTRLVRTASGYQVRQSINRDSIDRWHLYEPWLGPLAALIERPADAP